MTDETRQSMRKWFASKMVGSPGLEDMSEEQKGQLEFMLAKTTEFCAEKKVNPDLFQWARTPEEFQRAVAPMSPNAEQHQRIQEALTAAMSRGAENALDLLRGFMVDWGDGRLAVEQRVQRLITELNALAKEQP